VLRERGLAFYSCFPCTEEAGIGVRKGAELELDVDRTALQSKEFRKA
jgi:hypothetical protein